MKEECSAPGIFHELVPCLPSINCLYLCAVQLTDTDIVLSPVLPWSLSLNFQNASKKYRTDKRDKLRSNQKQKSGLKLCSVGKPDLYFVAAKIIGSRPLGGSLYKTNVLVLDPLDLTHTLPHTSARLSLIWADTPLTDHLVTCLNRPLLPVRQSLTPLRPKAGAINRFTCSKFTTDKLDSLRDVLEECYDLSNIGAAWAREPKFGHRPVHPRGQE